MSELAILIVALFGGGGIVALVLKRLWGLQDNATLAYEEGRAAAEADCLQRIDKIESDFNGYRRTKAAEIARMQDAMLILVSRVDDIKVRAEVFRALWGNDHGPEPGQ